MQREYTLCIKDGDPEMGYINCGRQKTVAVSKAREWAAKPGVTAVFLKCYRPHDGQNMFLNPDGNFALEGDNWAEGT